MIRCNLSILLAERNLKITQVSKDTGISRTTLTSLSSNYSQGIQFDTVNTLCNYLKITPEQLISYIPVDIEILDIILSDSTVTVNLNIIEKSKTHNISIDGILVDFLDTKTQKISAFELSLNTNKVEPITSTEYIKNIIDYIPITFKNDIETKILDKLLLKFDSSNISKDIKLHLEYV